VKKSIALAVLDSLNTLAINCALSVQVISGFLEIAELENRDLTEDELDAIIDLRIEEQKNVKQGILRNIIYEEGG